MRPVLAWSLAAAGLLLATLLYGWQGSVVMLSFGVFWLLLQFNRTVRALRVAGGRPIGHVDSALNLLPRLRVGLPLADLLLQTRSLGHSAAWPADELPAPEAGETVYRWDGGDDRRLWISLQRGRVRRWCLRAAEAGAAPAAPDQSTT